MTVEQFVAQYPNHPRAKQVAKASQKVLTGSLRSLSRNAWIISQCEHDLKAGLIKLG